VIRASTETSVRDWWYDDIIVVTHSGKETITIQYNPHRARVRRMNRLFNKPPAPADTSTPVWTVTGAVKR